VGISLCRLLKDIFHVYRTLTKKILGIVVRPFVGHFLWTFGQVLPFRVRLSALISISHSSRGDNNVSVFAMYLLLLYSKKTPIPVIPVG
jgi:hypothetical protein